MLSVRDNSPSEITGTRFSVMISEHLSEHRIHSSVRTIMVSLCIDITLSTDIGRLTGCFYKHCIGRVAIAKVILILDIVSHEFLEYVIAIADWRTFMSAVLAKDKEAHKQSTIVNTYWPCPCAGLPHCTLWSLSMLSNSELVLLVL